MQLDATSSNLNSNDAFILVTPWGSFLWVGVGASDTEKQGAQQLCDILGVSASELSEGGETGEGTAPTQNNNQSQSETQQPLTFSCRLQTVGTLLKRLCNVELNSFLFVPQLK